MKIFITRDPGFQDYLRGYRIILDGKEIGKIMPKETFEYDIEKGPHELYLKIDWTGSNKINFTVEDQDTKFYCKSNFKGIKSLFILYYVIESFFDHNNWITLEKVS